MMKEAATPTSPKCKSIKGLVVSVRWYLGYLKGWSGVLEVGSLRGESIQEVCEASKGSLKVVYQVCKADGRSLPWYFPSCAGPGPRDFVWAPSTGP